MSWRIVEIASNSKLELKLNYLVVRNTDQIRKVFIPEIAVLIIESTAISMTAAMLCELSKNKVKIIFCDESRNPYGELVPYAGSHDSADKLRRQIVWDRTVADEVWSKIVRSKISHQAKVLDGWGFRQQAQMLEGYVDEVIPGDVTNREGHAAKVYFNALFGMDFSRRTDCTINSALNYGYSMIMSVVAREITICGYDMRLGIFHDNGSNAYNLASDLMEPFRPLVDDKIKSMSLNEFGTRQKAEIVNTLNQIIKVNGKDTVLINAIRLYVLSVFDAIETCDIGVLKDYEAEVHASDCVF